MSVNYCRNCKLLYRDAQFCSCGRRLNATREEMLSKYMESGYHFAQQSVKETAADRAVKMAQIKEEISSQMGFSSVESLFSRENVIAQYEKERQGEQEKRIQEIQANKKKNEEEIDELRRRILEGGSALPSPQISTQVAAILPGQLAAPGDDQMDIPKINVKAFFDQLGLEKKR